MDPVIEKLAEIEKAAEAIVAHAQEQKSEIEKELQGERDKFDQELGEKTEKELDRIRREAKEKMDALLAGQIEKNHSLIDNLEKEFAENHTAYAREILKKITEV